MDVNNCYFHYYLIFWLSLLIIFSLKWQRFAKNARHTFAEPKFTSLNNFFCPINSRKRKDFSFTVMNRKEKQQIPTFQKQEPADVWRFCLKKMTETMSWLSKELLISRKSTNHCCSVTMCTLRYQTNYIHSPHCISKKMPVFRCVWWSTMCKSHTDNAFFLALDASSTG